MIDLPIVDTHLHLWDPRRLRYPWQENVPALAKPFLLDEYHLASESTNVEKMIFLECDCDHSQNHEEVAMITELAATEPRLQGIVAYAALELGEAVRNDLEKLASNSLVKGVRRITQDEQDPDFCNQEKFVEGVRLLAEFGFSCDLCIKPEQLTNTIQLVRTCPRVNFILDHLGKPDIRSGEFVSWAKQMKELSELPNAYCKLSGVVTEADLKNWSYFDIESYMQHAIDCFGPDRLVFGGDWPVVTLATSYSFWMQCVEKILESLDVVAQQNILHDNAIRFYRLEKKV